MKIWGRVPCWVQPCKEPANYRVTKANKSVVACFGHATVMKRDGGQRERIRGS